MRKRQRSTLRSWSDPRLHAEGGPYYPNADNFPALRLCILSEDQTNGASHIVPTYAVNPVLTRFEWDVAEGPLDVTSEGMTLNWQAGSGEHVSQFNMLPNATMDSTPFASGETLVVFSAGKNKYINGGGGYACPFRIGPPQTDGVTTVSSGGAWFHQDSSNFGVNAAVTVPSAPIISTPTHQMFNAQMTIIRFGVETGIKFVYANTQRLCGYPEVEFSTVAHAATVGAVDSMIGATITDGIGPEAVTSPGNYPRGMRCQIGGYFRFQNAVTDALLLSAVRWMAVNRSFIYPGFAGLE